MSYKYLKQPLASSELVDLLKTRNLSVPSVSRAIRYIDSIGYYRLTGYMFHMQAKNSHIFINGTSFDDVVNVYKFDKRLRAIMMEYLERVEVMLRTKLTDYYSLEYGFFWYTDENLINKVFKSKWQDFVACVKKDFQDPKDLFLKTYQLNYPDEEFPPSQMMMETLSMGELGRLFLWLSNNDTKKKIAADLRQVPTTLDTWFIWLANVRNICAHHGRLWNKIMPVDRPFIPTRKEFKFAVPLLPDSNIRMYGAVALINHLLKCFNPDNSFVKQVEELVDEYSIDATRMGFPANWKTTAVWHH